VAIDRLCVRQRPDGCPILHQRWHQLLFLHWRFEPNAVRHVVPAGLELDLFDGDAWVGLTPFTASRMRTTLLPSLPGLSTMHEINVRVYVHRDGIPGIWFPSLDATSALAVWGARLAYRLPYYRARMQVTQQANTVSFRSERNHRGAPPATFDATWEVGAGSFEALPGSLDFFLIERYVLYAGNSGRLLRARIHHRPWPLRRAKLIHLRSTMLEAQRLPGDDIPPVVHAQGESFDMAVWPPQSA
jgi:uncharacterized protein